ncbi:coenzyme F420-0:L-glutamate ligase [Demetria terragena]|uniref:coenzyme F420-0:L-glutamate ligase n=1 Tax=Demetria terragena TaxID=63959 RepID=UPI0003678640|nr:coenzyme F420-0:L-glutamate ligase [Demetria terragena]
MTVLEVRPILGVPEVRGGDNVGDLLMRALTASGEALVEGDILVVTSKIVSKADGLLATDAERTDLVLRESSRVVSERSTSTGVTRVVAALAGPVMAGAGIDASNVGDYEALLLPHDPDGAAHVVRSQLRDAGAPDRVGVVLSDTAGRPWRGGLTDFALGLAGIRALDDLRGAHDVDGREMAVTIRCLADEIAAAADLVKGKVEAVPAAVVRGLGTVVVTENGDAARNLVRAGPEDWFALGRAEAVRDALGITAGSDASTFVGIESVHPESLSERIERALRVAAYSETDTVQWEVNGADLTGTSDNSLLLGRSWARVEVALAGERLTTQVRDSRPHQVLLTVRER